MKKTVRNGCKINWFLKVTGKRPDGYHDIETLFQYLEYPSDTVSIDFDSVPGIRVSCDRADIPCDLANLAGKAAEAYADAADIVPHWEIFIEKGIPSAAGLGGGSSDAGTVLRMLEEQYRCLGSEKLAGIAAGIGADVPFFLDPGLVKASGIGEKRIRYPEPEELPPLLIVFPGFPVSAKWAYCNLDKQRISPASPGAAEELYAALSEGDIPSLAGRMHNDLEYALYEKFPLLEVIRKELCFCGALRVMVSGSGSSLIAVFDDKSARHSAAEEMRKLFESDPVSAVFETGGKCFK